ncbi:FtsB family cell division protein [Jatrophihabitans fulvus]
MRSRRVEPAGRRRRPALTGRALGLGALAVLLVVVLASPVHRYLASRSDVASAGSTLSDHRREAAQLQKRLEQYRDPGYIQQQARKRLQWAMPGDTVYVVVDKGARSEIERTRTASTPRRIEGASWNDRLMGTVHAADK